MIRIIDYQISATCLRTRRRVAGTTHWMSWVHCVRCAMTVIHDMTAADLLAAYKAKKLSPVEAVDAVIAHIETWEPKLKALYAPTSRVPARPPRRPRSAGRRASRGRAGRRAHHHQGEHRHQGRAGSARHRGDRPGAGGGRRAGLGPGARSGRRHPRQDHHARLRHAVVGPKLVPSADPQSLEPRLEPGGSSAGAGAAAAAGYGPLHLGTDIGGSVRLPACWNGIFTLKPSLGRVPSIRRTSAAPSGR